MTRPIRLAIFDMDDVLCHYDRDRRLRVLAHLSRRSPEEILRKIWDTGFEDASDAGEMDAREYLAGFGARLGCALSRDAWVDARRAGMIPFADVLAMVERVKSRATVAVLTNNGFLTAEALDTLFPGLRSLFDGRVFISAEFHMKKPEPEIYRRLCARLGFVPEEAFFTDDKAINVEGAMKAGLAGHVFTGAAGLRRVLTDHGLLD
ncbi:HAD family phosphatase [Chelatococcus sp. SYSU_G07232]|uniref:HAD family phosphatase n=1 Tax=Chelatococcus albus TaxID=3047466 RepID=A0ABT7AKW5_9HYPH|nr:HAD family phosphatase [Chelatococcus sp. SYSU_G07232]MDJ1160009.1 HAD family phosphatase [Chelatococcus sp. SYSU_G07232]